MNHYYSMLVDLEDKACLVVGGGTVAGRKIAALLEASASITVISPKFNPEIRSWIEAGHIIGINKAYDSKYSEDAFLVFAATDVESVNLQVYQDTRLREQLINIADHPELSNFHNPAVFSRGRLQISVSTSGASPSLAKDICNDLNSQYGDEYEILLDFLSEYRMKVQENVADSIKRQRLYQEMLQQNLLHIIRRGEFEAFRTQVLDKFGG